ncbi:MAG: hypothetical protein H6823_01380 [Planctomycetaceae bacterium]|nr:hypothetical protein [Planctomycetaceae bacterium]
MKRRSSRAKRRRCRTFEPLENRLALTGFSPPAFIPSQLVADDVGTIYLLSEAHDNVFRWSVIEDEYADPIQVGDAPRQLAYSAENDSLYVGYDSGAITQITLGNDPIEEHFFAVTPGKVTGLQTAGSIVFASDPSNSRTHYTFRADGTKVSNVGRNEQSATFEWSAANRRIYFTRDDTTPNDLHWESIDPVTGKITGSGDSPYHGDYSIRHPIRVSRDGTLVALGSGDVYDAISLKIVTSLPDTFADALWLDDGSLITIRASGGGTLLEHRDAEYELFNRQVFSGTPLRVLDAGSEITVVTQGPTRPAFGEFVPTDDVDNDGFDYRHDDFPYDPAASVDRDRDGAPDEWNAGFRQQDSTTGLVIDAFPDDSACQLAEHALPGQPDVCDTSSRIPAFDPRRDDVIVDDRGIIYVLSASNDRVYRWSIDTGVQLNPIVVGDAPRHISYADSTLYVAYESGEIRQLNVTDALPLELPFASTPARVLNLWATDAFLYASDPTQSRSHYTFSPNGSLISSQDVYYEDSRGIRGVAEWSSVTGRMYYLEFNDLYWNVINPLTGEFTGAGKEFGLGESALAPIRVSPDGRSVLFGSGDAYVTASFDLAFSLPYAFTDALWLGDGSVVTIRHDQNRTVLEQWDPERQRFNAQYYEGFPVRVVETNGRIAVVTSLNRLPQFVEYIPTDDPDNDGVNNRVDAFPDDQAASVDTDGDGFPDAWNEEFSESDSTSGLTLDAFPLDSECQLAVHGLPGQPDVCDIERVIPNFSPRRITADPAGIVYMIREDSNRVYRWSTREAMYLNSILVTDSPLELSYSTENKRLYLGYATGAITQVDVSEDFPREAPFAATLGEITGLQTAGAFVFAADPSNYDSHYTFAADGTQVSAIGHNDRSKTYEWNSATQRIYYTTDTFPTALRSESIDPVSGELSADGRRAYGISYEIQHRIRVSQDGTLVALGSGEVYDEKTLALVDSLPVSFVDAIWLSNGHLVTIRASADGQTLLEQWDDERRFYNFQYVNGTPQQLLWTGDTITVISQLNGKPQFSAYVPTNDADQDGVSNELDAFLIDPAASLDSDRDGAPDSWNTGYDQQSSTTGLVLDAFPFDAACQLAEHAVEGQPDVCDVGIRVPPYKPKQIVGDESGVVYLLSTEHQQIFRWDVGESKHLNPIGLSGVPTHIAVSPENNALYVAYTTGVIAQFDLASGREQELGNQRRTVFAMQAAGKFVFILTRDTSGYRYEVIDATGIRVSSLPVHSFAGRSFEFSSANNRLYFTHCPGCTEDVEWIVIDPITGELTERRDSGYRSNYRFFEPARVSRDGLFVALGSGNIFDAVSLEFIDSLPIAYTDAVWLDDGSLVTIRKAADDTVLEQWDSNLEFYNRQIVKGAPLGVIVTEGAIVVVTDRDGKPAFTDYVPTDDPDLDGVSNHEDAFPLDPTASRDTDGDGSPDAWNPGSGQADSVQGLSLDVFPLHSACQATAHAVPGDPATCDIAARAVVDAPDAVEFDEAGVIYLLHRTLRRIDRWSVQTQGYLNPIFVEGSPQYISYSTDNQRLYVGYASGVITQIDVNSEFPREVPFAHTVEQLTGLQTNGPFVLAQDSTSSYATYRTFVFSAEGNSNDEESASIHWGRYAMGRFGYDAQPRVVRLSRDGALIFVGSGEFFDALSQVRIGSLPDSYIDAVWLADRSLISIRESSDGGILLEHWDPKRQLVAARTFDGTPLRAVFFDGQVVVVTNDSTANRFVTYFPNDDADGDGAVGIDDAFPLDAAASVDSDRDGAPDHFNAGYSESDSTQGLRIDAFPNDPACQLPEHAAPGQSDVCLPDGVPNRTEVGDSGIIYFLHEESDRLLRWSTEDRGYLPPILLDDAPQYLAYSAENNRLYIAYASGNITQIDPAQVHPQQTPFARKLDKVIGIQAVGSFVFVVEDVLGTTEIRHYTFAADGRQISVKDLSRGAEEFEWSSINSRIYYVQQGVSPANLSWESIDRNTGAITQLRDSPYHGDFAMQHPARVSRDGAFVVLGSSEIFNAKTLAYHASLPVNSFTDALWGADGSLVTIRDAGDGRTLLEHWTADFRLFNTQYFEGTPQRILASGGMPWIVTHQHRRSSVAGYRGDIAAGTEGKFTESESLQDYELNVSGRSRSVYSLQIWRDAAAVGSFGIEIRNATGESVPVQEVFNERARSGQIATGVVVGLSAGRYIVRVSGSPDAGGAYRLELRLPGATRGDRVVDHSTRRLAEIALLQRDFGFSPVAKALFETRLGLDLNVDRFRSEFDANLNGHIDSTDLSAVISNAQDARPVIAAFTRIATQGNPLVGNETEYATAVSFSQLSFSLVQNPIDSYDVNGDGHLTPLDALLVINVLREKGTRSLDSTLAPSDDLAAQVSPPFYDVSGDYHVSPLDLLLILNRLSQRSEGEGTADSKQVLLDLATTVESHTKSTGARRVNLFERAKANWDLQQVVAANPHDRNNQRLRAADQKDKSKWEEGVDLLMSELDRACEF